MLRQVRMSSGAKPRKAAPPRRIQGVQDKSGRYTNKLYDMAKKRGSVGFGSKY